MTNSFRERFFGILPPVITPLDDDGNFDVDSARTLYQFHLDAGVHGLFLFGSSGEGPLLNANQREQTLKIATEVVAGRVPILAGVLTPGTQQAISQAQVAKNLGADALVVAPPFYFPATQNEVLNHFRAVRSAVDLPIVAYDIPVTTKVKIELPTMLKLAEEGTIVGVKDSSGDVAGFRRLLSRRPNGFKLLTGSELLVDSVMAMGADGSVPGLANVAPELFTQLYNHWTNNRFEEAISLQKKLVRLFDVFADKSGTVRAGSAIAGMKISMQLRGVITTTRLCEPFLPADDEQVERVRSILNELELLP
ncbi:MAG: dihydrodipicolinate synthase family protein [Planctomycetaceae bacterium]